MLPRPVSTLALGLGFGEPLPVTSAGTACLVLCGDLMPGVTVLSLTVFSLLFVGLVSNASLISFVNVVLLRLLGLFLPVMLMYVDVD